MSQIRFDIQLKPEQKDGIQHLLSRGDAGLCFSTGIGKTIVELVAAAHLANTGQVQYVCIFHLKSGLKAILDDVRDFSNIVLNNPRESSEIRPVPIFNTIQFNHIIQFEKELQREAQFHRVCAPLDEIQYIKVPTSTARKCFDRVRPNLDYVWGLTATPVGNRLDDLYHMSEYIKPGYFGDHWQFRNQYTHLKKRTVRIPGTKKRRTFFEVTGFKNLDHLQEKTADLWLIRSEEMPKEFKYINLGELSSKDEKLYVKAAKGIVEDSDDLRNFVNRLHPLQRVVDNSDIKLQRFKNALIRYKKRSQGCLVYFAIRDSLTELQRILPFDVEVITGSTSQKDRFRIKDEFVKDKILFCTAAGAKTLNFHAVDTVMFYNIPFEIELFIQMIGRIARPFVSEFEKIKVIMPYVNNTIDVYRAELNKSNAELVQFTTGSPNIPMEIKAKRRSALIKLRRDLLWRIKKAA